MVRIDIQNRVKNDDTIVSNKFIEKYMPAANGEYVKIYLYFLCLSSGIADNKKTMSAIADALECTSNDIIRALKYWEKKGVLSCSFNASGELTTLCFYDLTYENVNTIQIGSKHNISSLENIENNDKEVNQSFDFGKQREIQISENEKEKLKLDENIKCIMNIAEAYLNRPLTSEEIETFMYFYDTLGFDVELIDYLIDYSVGKNKSNINYMKAVAFAWYDKHIDTVEKAKEENRNYSKTECIVKQAFGIDFNNLGKVQKKYIDKWSNKFMFDDSIIEEACNRTLENTGGINFKYADKIIESWHDNDVKTIDDIKDLDKKHEKKREKKSNVNFHSRKSKPISLFHDYEKGNYDYDEIEKALLF